jgi:hypothetical protein
MKKTLSLVALLTAGTLVLAGCNQSTTVENETLTGEAPVIEEESTAKESLDLGELISLIETHFPKSYEYSVFNTTDKLIGDEGKHVYNRMELGYLTPEYSNIVDRKIIASSIEDDMIYTDVEAALDN